ncbi:hypothetical protein SAM23877_3094 [Streptomyces ambofaciens ATCC 23877]|uniref:Uncharacterized protein n=1 Tax=Streptomyces ambofaciens (strain ATCC 23877 / 3486 / DSM 40053 / JCM 4204 / NBRC 12836 / NRRL B-2516) TaxID=278992 RepID=A0A0K2AT47_STRA7|nr:hypothetical protein SAM23877_3094 [Streptomyces ambofaciens ATCC 23877]
MLYRPHSRDLREHPSQREAPQHFPMLIKSLPRWDQPQQRHSRSRDTTGWAVDEQACGRLRGFPFRQP